MPLKDLLRQVATDKVHDVLEKKISKELHHVFDQYVKPQFQEMNHTLMQKVNEMANVVVQRMKKEAVNSIHLLVLAGYMTGIAVGFLGGVLWLRK